MPGSAISLLGIVDLFLDRAAARPLNSFSNYARARRLDSSVNYAEVGHLVS